MTTPAICLSEVGENLADQELASLRAALDGTYIDTSEAELVRDRIIESLRLAGLQYRRFRGSHNTECDRYGSADARWLAALARSLYARIPRDRRILREGGKLERISQADIGELELLRSCATHPGLGAWRPDYYNNVSIGDTTCAFAIGPRHEHGHSGAELAESKAEHDARFIEAAYKQMPALLLELRRAREALRDLVAELEGEEIAGWGPALQRAREQLMQWEPDKEDAP
jgi:hypothetical protein